MLSLNSPASYLPVHCQQNTSQRHCNKTIWSITERIISHPTARQPAPMAEVETLEPAELQAQKVLYCGGMFTFCP